MGAETALTVGVGLICMPPFIGLNFALNAPLLIFALRYLQFYQICVFKDVSDDFLILKKTIV